MSSELLPCLFCGGEDWLCPPHRGDRRVVTCRQCGCRTDWLVGLGAVETWNTRAERVERDEVTRDAD